MKKLLFILLALSFSCKVVYSANALTSIEERVFPVIETFVTETDGIYDTPAYLYNIKANKFFVGANEWGTRASIGNPGWKVKVLKHLDSQRNWDGKTVSIKNYVGTKGWYTLGFISNELWTDCSSQADTLWTILKNGDYYRFEVSTKNPLYNNFSGTFLGVNLTEGDTRLYPDKADTEENMIEWAFVTESRYEEYQHEILIYNKAQELKTWIEKAEGKGIDVSSSKAVYQNMEATINDLEAATDDTKKALAKYDEQHVTPDNPEDKTSLIVNPNHDNDRADGWQGTDFYADYNVAEYYEKDFTLYQDLANLPKGVYAISVQAFCRKGWADEAWNQYENGEEMPAKIYAGTTNFTASTPIKNICNGASETLIQIGANAYITDNHGKAWYIPNNMAAAEAYFNDATLGEKFISTLFFATDGDTVRFGLQQDEHRAGNWVLWDNWQLTYYGNQTDSYKLWLNDAKINAPRFDENALITKSLLEAYNKSLTELTANDYATALEAVMTIERQAADIKANIEAWEKFQKEKNYADYIIQDKNVFWCDPKRELDDYMSAKGNSYLEKLELTTEEIIKETEYLQSLNRGFYYYENGHTLIGAVWSYVHFDRTGKEEQNSYTRYTVLNEPIEIDRTTYVPLVEYTTCEFQKGDEIKIYRIRQEGQRIYVLKEDAAEIADGLTLQEEGNDYVLYDFGLAKGEEFCKISNNGQSITISDTATITSIDGETFNTLHINGNQWIEGIGSVHGLLDILWNKQFDCDCGTVLNYFCHDKIYMKTEYKNPLGNIFGQSTEFKATDCVLGAEAVEETLQEKSTVHLQTIGSTLFCTSPNAVKLDVYTMDALKVGEASFINGEAVVKVNKTPATYLYIVTYPDGRRESGKVMVK